MFDFFRSVEDSCETKLNTTQTKYEKPEEFWQELGQFRDENKEECVSTNRAHFDGTINSLFDTTYTSEMLLTHPRDNLEAAEDGVNHKCIHSYTLNERLFPVPICKDKNGQSTCPVCRATKKEGTSYSPQFCKISIPKGRIAEPITVEPIRRTASSAKGNNSSKYNNEDTLSLSEVTQIFQKHKLFDLNDEKNQ
jgi:hypothetical protein